MIVYPAVDIRDGKAVRLTHGRFDAETVYNDDPLEAARSWVEAGARFLHVVDLDGARAGEPASIDHLRRIVAGTGVPVQYGGGLRSVEAVRDALRAGAERVIVGTAALRDVDFLDDILAAYGPRVVVSVDVRGGKIATAGWTQVSELPATDAIERLHDRGVALVRLHRRGPRRRAGGAVARGRRGDRGRGARALPLRRRHRRRSSTCARCAGCARSTWRA